MKHVKIGNQILKVKRIGSKKQINALKVKYKAPGQTVQSVKVQGDTWALVISPNAPAGKPENVSGKETGKSKKKTATNS